MTEINPYKAYADDSILNNTPLGLVVALYEGAIDASKNARKCLVSNDIPGRTKSINKIVSILTELMMNLNDEKGGEVSQNLRRLYVYIQGRVIEAHIRKSPAPLEEVEKLLSTVLDGWRQADALQNAAPALAQSASAASAAVAAAPPKEDFENSFVAPYGSYFPESGDFPAVSAYGF